ncbi:hypothetical protein [Flavobacterium sp. '19STA2R22 D10 B1']|uniref:hypothetical protein n=1 Tax=Flavobacterium aerium TaxID=3037261 RepID=UPI00278C58C2|nr:hypothetical protein [Flavobacterium sp. '19STA2R22 D10 B1']
MIPIVERKELNLEEKIAIYRLWNQEYPEKLNYTAVEGFEAYLANLSKITHYLMIDDKDQIVAWSSTFEREGALWFAVIIAGNLHGKGYGHTILNHLKSKESTLNGWVIDHEQDKKKDGTIYLSPLSFYLKNDFIVYPDNRLELEKMSAVHIQWNK